jgi:hypothetical protein
VTCHGALLVAAVAAFYRYGDRTDVTDKSLRGTNEALEGLRAYLSRALAEAIRPTIERIIGNAVPAEAALLEMRGESFQDDISSFVNSEIEEILSYRNLLHARKCWSAWSHRISWALFTLLVVEGLFAGYFGIVAKVMNRNVTPMVFFVTLGISVLVVGFCLICSGAMLYHHDRICDYRDKVL